MSAEQNNSLLQRIKKQASYMTQFHFMLYVRFFLYIVNRRKNRRMTELSRGFSGEALKWQDRQVKFLHGIGRLKGYASV
jgi:hypothetical protein